MTTELTMLVWTAVLSLAAPVVYLVGRLQVPGGMQWALGNRETDLPVPEWTRRAQRAHANLVENLAPFAILVLVAHVAGKTGSLTAWGATLFFLGRVAHFAVYTAGITVVRTLVFFVAVFGEVLILAAIVR